MTEFVSSYVYSRKDKETIAFSLTSGSKACFIGIVLKMFLMVCKGYA